jgi:hypothetical protein
LDLAVPVPHPTVRYSNRLFAEILVAFHGACDQRDDEVAFELLRVFDFMAARKPPLSDIEVRLMSLVAAHERLWEIQHLVRIRGQTQKAPT